MKSRSSTAKALLGLLSIAPMSGYDIRSLISRSISHFWTESFGQIYPALRVLEECGLVKKKSERQAGKPDRNLYSLTEAGREELGEWLKLPPEQEVPRNALLLKLFFGGQAAPGVSAGHVRAFMEREAARREVYRSTRKRLLREAKGNPQLPFCLMTLSCGEHRSEAMSKWCKETLLELERLEKKDGAKSRKKSKEAANA